MMGIKNRVFASRGANTQLNSRERRLSSELLEQRVLLAVDTPIISEFMASNDNTLVDQFGLSRDWIEIFNPTPDPISLSNWHLTDDQETMDKWTFPDVQIQPGEFMTVFASGEDIKGTAQPFHTNFRLRAEGEYLALVKPDMTVAHEFKETYPKQFADVSYGLGAAPGVITTDDSRFSYHVPSSADAALGTDWTNADFDDSAWRTSEAPLTQGVGFAISNSADDFAGLIATDVGGLMLLNNASLWMRQEFEVTDPGDIDGLLLDLNWDDGYAIFLNGEQIRDVNLPETGLAWNAEAEVPRRPRRRNSLVVETADQLNLGEHTNLIVQGTNVLAIQALNDTSIDSELYIKAHLRTITMPDDIIPSLIGYISEATPGSANRPLLGGSVDISADSQIFTDTFAVELSSTFTDHTIRYTTDGTDPTVDSTEYTGPIEVSGSMQLRTTAFAPDGGTGPISKRTFTKMADDIKSFSASLPLMVFSTEIDQLSRVRKDQRVGSFITLFEPGDDGRTRVTNEPVMQTFAELDRRGSSTSGNPKLNMAVEFQTESGADNAVPLLGMPADSDWVFYAPYNFDRTKGARNSFFYEIANQVGRYAPRTRIIEVFHVVNGADLTADDYQGIYVVIEKIQRDEHKVNIEKLGPDDIAEPDVTGGWIFKIDRNDAGDGGFRGGRQGILYVNPKEDEVLPEQEEWVQGFFDNMDDVFRNADSTWEQITDIIDVGSWIDHAIVNTMTFNLDAYRLSGYFFKDRDGKLEMGPIWDCDRCMGSEDSRDNDPEVWNSRVSDFGTDFFNYPWWVDLYRNQPNFWQAWIDRWFELRQEVMSDSNIASLVDTYAAQIEEAHERDTTKWRQTPNGGPFDPLGTRDWEGEVRHLKGFNQVRVDWIDARFVAQPMTSPDGGQFTAGQQVTLSAPAGTIYYTTDGSDPRASGGAVSASAIAYSAPITINEPTTFIARAFDDSEPVDLNPNRLDDDPRSGSFWSAPITEHFTAENFASASSLRITEVNYNPQDATAEELQKLGPDAVTNGINNDEFEFLEVMNISDQPIELAGTQLVRVLALDRLGGVVFTFAPQTLDPGERVVVVENVPAFRARYGDAIRIAKGSTGEPEATDGQYGGQLDNVGETLRMIDTHGDLILRFLYDDSSPWPERADGHGSSIELIDVNGDFTSAANWRASSDFGGSPGASGEEAANRLIVTEVLSSSTQPQGDRLELFNSTSQPLDISGWLISEDNTDANPFRVPASTVVPAGGYTVFTEAELGFGFDEARGGAVTIIEADASGKAIRFAANASFGVAMPNVSLGRWPDNSGEFFPMAQSTFGGANSGVRTGDVIITEVYYNPSDPDGPGTQRAVNFEYIELFNQTGSEVDLTGWRLAGSDVDFAFAEGTKIGSGEAIVMTSFDPESNATRATTLRFLFNVPRTVQLLGDAITQRRGLNDEFGTIQLIMPGAPAADDPNVIPTFIVDELTYSNEAPWPTDVNETGNSLTRISGQDVGFLARNWTAQPASPGAVELTTARTVGDSNGDGVFNQLDIVAVLSAGLYLTGQPATFEQGDWNGDGVFNTLDIVAALRDGNYQAAGAAALAPSSAGIDTLLAKESRDSVNEADLLGDEDQQQALDEFFAGHPSRFQLI